MKEMNNLLWNTVYGEEIKRLLMKNYTLEFQKEHMINNSQLLSGPTIWIERTTI